MFFNARTTRHIMDSAIAQGVKCAKTFAQAILAAVMVLPGFAADNGDEPTGETSLEPYVRMIGELNVRRRVNTLFPNPQSILDGLHVGYVNAGRGNLTFQRRDLAIPSPTHPIVVARVHDSDILKNSDFGPRWRLSLAEEVVQHKQHKYLTYYDDSGASYTFKKDGRDYHNFPATPKHLRTEIELREDSILMQTSDGCIRIFEPSPRDRSRYVISAKSCIDGHAIAFTYSSSGLSRVSDNLGREIVRISRDPTARGRITSIVDRYGRQVDYSYSETGLLTRVNDVGGNTWSYSYTTAGLSAAVDPGGRPFLSVEYHANGQVARTKSTHDFSFQYRGNSTSVLRGSEDAFVFFQNETGATTRHVRQGREQWSLHLDESSRITGIDLADETYSISYNTRGNISQVLRDLRFDQITQVYDYDEANRLIRAWSPQRTELGTNVTYDTNSTTVSQGATDMLTFHHVTGKGIISVASEHHAFTADHDASGNVVAIGSDDHETRFERNTMGRIASTVYANGWRNEYTYDSLGNRTVVRMDDFGYIRYRHDPSGNIVQVQIEEADGEVRASQYTVGPHNRVERIVYSNGWAFDIDYDDDGNPVTIATESDVVRATFSAEGQLTALSSTSTGETRSIDEREEPEGIDAFAIPLFSILGNDLPTHEQPDYGAVRFQSGTLFPILVEPMVEHVPGLVDATELFDVGTLLYTDHLSMINFEKPSNVLFQPTEYMSTNCCVPCGDPINCPCATLIDWTGRDDDCGFDCTLLGALTNAIQAAIDALFEEEEEEEEDVASTPPGDCTWGRHSSLQSEVDRYCHPAPGCKGNWECPEIAAQMERTRRCIGARNTINSTCFRGGNDIHKQALQEAVNAEVNCQRFWAEKSCQDFWAEKGLPALR